MYNYNIIVLFFSQGKGITVIPNDKLPVEVNGVRKEQPRLRNERGQGKGILYDLDSQICRL